MSTEIKGSRCVEQTGTYPSERNLAGTACSVSNRSDAEQKSYSSEQKSYSADQKSYSFVQKSYSSEQKSYSADQKEVADKTYQLIMCNLERHLTIVEMARNLHVSPTQVKVCFRKVYGVPVFTFARKRRMEMAAKLLAETDESILEIAGRIGYENGSKFARAFRDVMGISPGRYRRIMLMKKEESEAV